VNHFVFQAEPPYLVKDKESWGYPSVKIFILLTQYQCVNEWMVDRHCHNSWYGACI